MPRRRWQRRRKGAIALLTAFFLFVVLSFLALSIDSGYLFTVRNQAQRTADAAAIAATWELINPDGPTPGGSFADLEANARYKAGLFAGYNRIGQVAPELATTDVEVGYLENPADPTQTIDTSGALAPNVVRVRVRRDDEQNGRISLFFGRAIGTTSASIQAEATAAVLYNFGGFRSPGQGGGNLNLLPFALDLQTWQGMLAGGGTDNYCFDAQSGHVHAGADCVREVNLYPQGTGSPGNRGTVDIGSSNNSTADIARQIVYGISAEDMEQLGHSLALDENGELTLNGDTGISAGVKDELASIIGQTRIIPIFSTVSGPGNNAQYTIVCFAGVRIMHVKLTGKMSGKKVVVQPANVVARGGIPSAGTTTSNFIYSPVWLVR